MFAAVVLCVAMLGAACGPISVGGGADDTPTPIPPTPTATPKPLDLTIFRNFTYPIAGACMPVSDALMPNASREYRSGNHEGVDFYEYDNCTAIGYGDPALAAKDGVVVRADLYYRDLTEEDLAAANEQIAAGNAEAFEVVDLFRGRQVWIDHGDGIVTRYAHLSAIAEGIEEGAEVVQGQTIAYIGDSGTPESLTNPRLETHLHWELRVKDSYLAAGLPPEEMREIYTMLFEPWP
jgi:murein DD-endopeptidase MepM/ murein hydrolase activator NlpD